MKIAVIGGTGFLGNALVDQLVIAGDDILVIGRKPRPDFLVSQADYVQSDCTEISQLKNILRHSQAIIDFSYTTTPKTSFDDPLSDLTSNVPRAVALFEACKNLSKLEKLIVVSSGGTVYGKVNKLPIAERAPTRPLSPYGITKLTIEQYAHLYNQMYDLPVIIVRPANAYGPKLATNYHQGFINVAFQRILNNQEISIYGDQGTTRDYVYIDDVTAALQAVIKAGKLAKTYNIGTGQGTNNLQLLELLMSIVPQKLYPVQYKIEPARTFDVPANILDSKLLTKQTGWQPRVGLPLGLKKTWEHYLHRNKQ